MGIETASSQGIKQTSAVATTSSSFSLHFSESVKTHEQNRITSLLEVATSCIKGYAKRNKAPPKELIVFMLAVPQDQINLIQEDFAKKIEKYVK